MSVSLQNRNLHPCKFTGGWSSTACVRDAPAEAYMVHVPFLVHESNCNVALSQQQCYQFTTAVLCLCNNAYKKNTGHLCPVPFCFLFCLFAIEQNFVSVCVAFITCKCCTVYGIAHIADILKFCIKLAK